VLLTSGAGAARFIPRVRVGAAGAAGETSNCPTAGHVPITIRGQNFGAADATARVGERACPTVSTAPDEVVCTLPEGSGARRSVVVVDNAHLESLPTPLLSYAPPAIGSVSGCGVEAPDGSTSACPRSGNIPITIVGSNFGPDGAAALVDGEPCPPTTPGTHESIVCTLPPGSGADRSVLVSAADGQVSANARVLSYAQCAPGERLVADACEACPAGTFSSSPDAASCDACPAGSASVAGASSCTGATDFRCWKTKDLKQPKFEALAGLLIDDEIATGGRIDVRKSTMFCAAADIGATGAARPDVHQCCYQARGDKLASATSLETVDDLGQTLRVSVQQPSMVCTSCSRTFLP
jgi:hypothetical protein